MPRLSPGTLPKFRKHRASGQAVVTLGGRDHYLGPHGTTASKREYDLLCGEYLTSGIRGSSFAFIVNRQKFTRGTGLAPDVREILDVTLLDCSPVVYPAYSATSSL